MLKKSIHGLFQHAKQKARFLLCFIFQTLSVFEKWRYVLIPRRRVLKNEFFSTLLIYRRANVFYQLAEFGIVRTDQCVEFLGRRYIRLQPAGVAEFLLDVR